MTLLIPSDAQPSMPQCGSAIRSLTRFLCPPSQRIPSASAEAARSTVSTSPSHLPPSVDGEWFIGSIDVEALEQFAPIPCPAKR